MLPNSDYLPAAFKQLAIYAAIAGLVAGDLGQPECRTTLRPSRVFRTAVLETGLTEGWIHD